jgi:small subunit ribosomal protein S12e
LNTIPGTTTKTVTHTLSAFDMPILPSSCFSIKIQPSPPSPLPIPNFRPVVAGRKSDALAFSMSDGAGGVIAEALRQINLSGRVAKGFNCTVKALLKGKAKIVFLCDDCDNKDYKALITGLCRKKRIPLQQFSSKKDLAVTFGLYQVRSNGTVRGRKKDVGCSACAVVKYPGTAVNPAVEEFRAQFDPPEGAATA